MAPATGLIAFTRMPKGASSTAMVLVAVFIQPFELLYQFRLGRGDTPAVDAIFKIAPAPRAFMAGTKVLAVR